MDTYIKKIEDHSAALKKTLSDVNQKIVELDRERAKLLAESGRIDGAIIGYEDCARLLKGEVSSEPTSTPDVSKEPEKVHTTDNDINALPVVEGEVVA